jgi:hypothetical protein
MLACPSCHQSIKTSVQFPTLPVQIKCPGCGHVGAKESFVAKSIHSEIANQFQAEAPTPNPVRVSTFEKVLNIEYQSTKSYAAYLWIMAIVVAIGVDGLAGLFILITSGKSFIASMGTVLGVHLIALPIIRVMLELVINVERIAKR